MKSVKVVKAKSTKSLMCAHTRARVSTEMLIKRYDLAYILGGLVDDFQGERKE